MAIRFEIERYAKRKTRICRCLSLGVCLHVPLCQSVMWSILMLLLQVLGVFNVDEWSHLNHT